MKTKQNVHFAKHLAIITSLNYLSNSSRDFD